MTDSQLRAKAKEIIDRIDLVCSRLTVLEGKSMLIDLITEALVGAYKQGAMSRVQLPERKLTHADMESPTNRRAIGWNECLDAIKITTLSAEDILPSVGEFGHHHLTQGTMQIYEWLRDFVRAKLYD